MNEQWVPWATLEVFDKSLFRANCSVADVYESSHRLAITILPDTYALKTMSILFTQPVEAYRKTNETYFGGVLNYLHEQYGPGYWGKRFFKVSNSSYIHWFLQQSAGPICNQTQLIHFVVIGCDYIIDVIAQHEPEIHIVPWSNAKMTWEFKKELLPYFIRYFPGATVTLYGGDAPPHDPLFNEVNVVLNLALDAGTPLDQASLQALDQELKQSIKQWEEPIPYTLIDFQTASCTLQEKIVQEGIVWKTESEKLL